MGAKGGMVLPQEVHAIHPQEILFIIPPFFFYLIIILSRKKKFSYTSLSFCLSGWSVADGQGTKWAWYGNVSDPHGLKVI